MHVCVCVCEDGRGCEDPEHLLQMPQGCGDVCSRGPGWQLQKITDASVASTVRACT